MKKIFLSALAALCLTACVNFKTEATVDVEVTQKGQPLVNVTVYKFRNDGLGESSTLYKTNAAGSAVTNAAGVAHFDLKSPDDFAPSNIAGQEFSEENTFFFCTYDANDDRNAIVTVTLHTGDKKTVQLDVPEGLVNP